jgi:hypothetical protein
MPSQKRKPVTQELSPSPSKPQMLTIEQCKQLIQEAIKPLQDEIQNVKKLLQNEIFLRSELEKRVIRNESHSRRLNLKFLNVKEIKGENLKGELINIFSHIGFVLPPRTIERAHRIGAVNKNNPRPVIVKFFHENDKELILRNSYKLWTNLHIKVVEDFPPEIAEKRKVLETIAKTANISCSSETPVKATVNVDRLILNNKAYTIEDLQKLPPNLHPENIFTRKQGNMTAFFTKHSPLSNHSHSPFFCNNIQYTTVEQYYMHQKALLFKDHKTAQEILTST